MMVKVVEVAVGAVVIRSGCCGRRSGRKVGRLATVAAAGATMAR